MGKVGKSVDQVCTAPKLDTFVNSGFAQQETEEALIALREYENNAAIAYNAFMQMGETLSLIGEPYGIVRGYGANMIGFATDALSELPSDLGTLRSRVENQSKKLEKCLEERLEMVPDDPMQPGPGEGRVLRAPPIYGPDLTDQGRPGGSGIHIGVGSTAPGRTPSAPATGVIPSPVPVKPIAPRTGSDSRGDENPFKTEPVYENEGGNIRLR